MPVRRKVFRIEQMGPIGTPTSAFSGRMSERQQREIIAEVKALRELMERRSEPAAADNSAPRDVADEANSVRQALRQTQENIAVLYATVFRSKGESRTTRDLNAVAANVEDATQRILDATEAIDEAAKNLAAALKLETNQSMALDIQDQVLRILEACNFQDLTGQRITKVLAVMKLVEKRITRMMELWGGLDSLKADARAAERLERRATLRGPGTDTGRKHISQNDVDVMFAARRA